MSHDSTEPPPFIIPYDSAEAISIRNSSDWWSVSDKPKLAIYWNKINGDSRWLAKINETDPQKLLDRPYKLGK